MAVAAMGRRGRRHARCLAAAAAVIVLLAMSPAAVPVSRSWLRSAGSLVALVAGRPAMAQGVNAAIRSLSRPRPRPETGVQLSSDLGIMEGDADASGARLVAAEVLASTKVTTTWNDEEVSFTSPWPVERASAGKSLEVRSKGASVFLQVILSGESLTSEGLLDEVLSSKGKFGAYGLPDAIKVLSDEAENGRRTLMIEFTSYSPRGARGLSEMMAEAL
ncbi:unnamed protein product [Cladocopium goreaui]|uniref:Choline transporter-like protein 2 n=1 Tax=Cladocopium goreaui TaxID=2562237 RepID=A0A9P1G1T1_9DINO|nr:unnamed protein product [Cladocopium goreaui]